MKTKRTKRGYKVKVLTNDGEHKKEFNNVEDAFYYADVLMELGYRKSDIMIKDNREIIIY